MLLLLFSRNWIETGKRFALPLPSYLLHMHKLLCTQAALAVQRSALHSTKSKITLGRPTVSLLLLCVCQLRVWMDFFCSVAGRYTHAGEMAIYICPYYNIDAILFIWCNKLQAHKYEIGLAREKRRNSESECRENGKIGSWSVFGSQMCVDTMCSAHCWHFDGKMAIECSEELQCSWFKDSCFSGFFFGRFDTISQHRKTMTFFELPNLEWFCIAQPLQIRLIVYCLLVAMYQIPSIANKNRAQTVWLHGLYKS